VKIATFILKSYKFFIFCFYLIFFSSLRR